MHLFAGIGGGLLSDLILGHEPIIAVEWDKYCCQILRERAAEGWFPDLHVWEGDIRLFDPSEYKGRVDCIHAGFPCQDISTAGNQKGIGDGTRSGLYREVLRIADEVRPRYLFLENVAAIVTGDNGGWLRTIIADLAERGYVCKWRCISAAEVGANHKRDRWWLLGYAEHAGRDASEIARSIASGSDSCETGTEKTGELARPIIPAAELAYSERKGIHERWVVTDACEGMHIGTGIYGHGLSDVEKLQQEILAYPDSIRPVHGESEKQPAEGREYAQRDFSTSGKDVADTHADPVQRLEQESQPGGHKRSSGLLCGEGSIQPCQFCGYEFDHELLGKYGCPNCEG